MLHAGSGFLLRDHLDIRRGGPQPGDDQCLGLVVGLGDRRAVVLLQRLEPAGAHGEDDRAGLPGKIGGEGQEGCIFHGLNVGGVRALAKPNGAATVGRTRPWRQFMLDIAFAHPVLPASGALALLVPEGGALAGIAAAADAATDGTLTRAFAAAKFTGQEGIELHGARAGCGFVARPGHRRGQA